MAFTLSRPPARGRHHFSSSIFDLSFNRGYCRVRVNLLWAALYFFVGVASAEPQRPNLEQWQGGVTSRIRSTFDAHAQLRQGWVADRLHIKSDALRLILKGRRPTLRQGLAIANLFGVDPECLFDFAGLRRATQRVRIEFVVDDGSLDEIILYARAIAKSQLVSSATSLPKVPVDGTLLSQALASDDASDIEAAWRSMVARRLSARLAQTKSVMDLDDLEIELGLPSGALTRFWLGRRTITLGEGLALAHVFGSSADWLLYGEGLRRIPLETLGSKVLASFVRWAHTKPLPLKNASSIQSLFDSELLTLRQADPSLDPQPYFEIWKRAVGLQLKILITQARSSTPEMTQGQLALNAGLTSSILSLVLSGSRSLAYKSAVRLASTLNVSVDQLLLADELRDKYHSKNLPSKNPNFKNVVLRVLNCAPYLK